MASLCAINHEAPGPEDKAFVNMCYPGGRKYVLAVTDDSPSSQGGTASCLESTYMSSDTGDSFSVVDDSGIINDGTWW